MNKRFIYRDPGTGSPGGANPEAEALLQKIKDNVKQEIETRGYQNAEAVQKIMDGALTGLNLDALRSFETEKEKLETSIKNIAGELEKVKQTRMAAVEGTRSAIRQMLDNPKTWDLIKRAFDKSNPQTVVLNTRAAAIMTLDNVIDEYDIPDDIIESFSVDSFIKKRRPYQYIFDVSNHRTDPTIKEYMTWLEEGDEEGAFAIVEEGVIKPLVSKTLVRNHVRYKKVAGKRVYTEEFNMFRREAYGILEELFNQQLLRNYQEQLTSDLIGIAVPYVATALDGQYTAPTDYHAIGAAAAQSEGLNFYPDILVINPQDKWRIALEQNSIGSFFVNIPMYDPNGNVIMMGFRVITSTLVDVGNAVLLEAGLFNVHDMPVVTRLGYGIDVTKTEGVVTDVTSDIDNNRFRIISEFFYHAYIGTNYTGSAVYFNFDAVKELLTAPVSP